MKKIFFIIIGLIFLIFPQKADALSPIDQVCSTGVAGSTEYTFLSHTPIQTFVPTKNTLDAVSVYIKGDIGASFKVRVDIISEVGGGSSIANKTQSITNQWSWVVFDFNDVAMPYGLYGILLADIEGKSTWKHGPANCYDRGYALYDGQAHLEFDYGFAVYAYNSENPQSADESSISSTPSSAFSSATTKGSGATPSKSTSSVIKPPTNLIAEDVLGDRGGAIFLRWLPSSSTDIDGYKIFRSESENGEFREIARAKKIIGGYTDNEVIDDKTYYYFLRSYKGNIESENSNIANAKSFNDIEEILKDFEANKDSGRWWPALGILIPIIILGILFIFFVGFIIILYFITRRRTTGPPKK